MYPVTIWKLIGKTLGSWSNDNAPSMGAALAFYTMFSIAPLLLIVIAVAGYFFGPDAARGEIAAQLTGLMGKNGAQGIEDLVASAGASSRRGVEAGIGVLIFLIGATSVFTELQSSLNRIWRVQKGRQGGGIFNFIRARLLSFGMILAISFLLVVSLLISAALSFLGKWWGPDFGEWHIFAQSLSFLVSVALITVTFALIYKVVPQKTVYWRDVWIGAATTSLLFTVGKVGIGIYLGRSSAISAFGRVGSMAVFLLWVYYSAQIFLLGAEFTWIYSNTRGKDGRLARTAALDLKSLGDQAPK